MQQILWLVPVLSVQLIHRTMPMTSVSWQEKWPYFHFLYNLLLICIPALDKIRETWKIWQWPVRKLMQEKNICWRGRFGAVLGPCFAVEAFQTYTECHGRNDVFPRQPGTTRSGRWLSLPRGSAGAVSSGAHQHTPTSALTVSPPKLLQF